MELQERTVGQNCNFQDQNEVLLSQRMDSLSSAPVKSLLSLHNITPIPSDSQPLTSPISNKENFQEKTIKKVEDGEEKTKMKCAHMKRTSAAKKQRFSFMEGVRLFEIGEAAMGRRSMLTEVKNMRVSEFTGRGLLILPNGKKYEGEWVQGNLIGQAKITYPNGDIYLGSIYNYQRHGRGYLYFSSGEKYEGEFSCGDFHGEGIFYDKNGGVKFDGEWRRGKMLDK